MFRLFVLLLLPFIGSGSLAADFFDPTPLSDPDKAMVYVYRPAASNPGKKPLRFKYPEVMIDGASAGFLKYNQYLAVEVAPGKREFVVTGLTRDAKWEPRDRKYSLTVEPGQSYFMRFQVAFDVARMSLGTFSGQYIITLHPVDESDAVYEIRHTKKSSEK